MAGLLIAVAWYAFWGACYYATLIYQRKRERESEERFNDDRVGAILRMVQHMEETEE